MTQSQLQSRSKVSRSYLSRIESGQMTPSLGTLEKISEALNVGLNRFFIPESDGEALLEDPFIQGLRPFLRPTRLGTVAVHIEEVAGHQRPRSRQCRLLSALSVIRRGCRSPRRRMATATVTSAWAIRMGLAHSHAHGNPQGYPLRRPGAPFGAQGKPVFQRPLAR